MKTSGPENLVVVDACVARSAGLTERPMSALSRNALLTIDRRSLTVLFSPSLDDEWKKHASKLALSWKVKMMSRRRIKMVRDKKSALLRKKIRTVIVEKPHVDALMKDVHLFELALEYACGIVSMEGVAQRIATSLASEYAPLARVQWVNLLLLGESGIHWLEADMADHEIGRLLPRN